MLLTILNICIVYNLCVQCLDLNKKNGLHWLFGQLHTLRYK